MALKNNYCNFANRNRSSDLQTELCCGVDFTQKSPLNMNISRDEIQAHIDTPLLRLISRSADEMHLDCYLIGGFVRDFFLCLPSKDIDVVAIGKGIDLGDGKTAPAHG